MPLSNPTLVALAEAYGIATQFWDWKGRLTEIGDETVIGILRGMEIDASSDEAAHQALEDHRLRPWRRALPPCVVMEQGTGAHVNVHVDAGAAAVLTIRLEDGGVRETWPVENWEPDREIDGRWVGEGTFWIPADLPLGYHRLHLECNGWTAEDTIIVSPHFLGFPSAMGEKRVWGYATQLYSVRSMEGWGIGDLSDLADIATWSATQQFASYVLTNPLHAAEPVAPIEPSPYLPSSRRYVNPLYIRPEDITEYATMDDRRRRHVRKLKESLEPTRHSEHIERNAIWDAKLAALRIIYDADRPAARQMSKDDFLRREGRQLTHFATWCVLFGELGMNWREWPAEYRRPNSPQVAAFAEEHADDVDFHIWLQWIADNQLSAAQRTARDAGMTIGVMNDLAVGVSKESAEAWTLGDAFAQGVSVGAPPDHYNQLGQDWGQAPWRPDRLEELSYQPFRHMVAGILRHSGGIRVDHIMGLFRLWWIPDGLNPTQGSYVRYNHEAMVGILVLEAHRAGALVVGEDLGTVEPWVRTYLRDRGLLGTSIAWFEVGPDGVPLPPEQYRDYCMASVTTHDLPPTAGYLAKAHIALQDELGLLTEDRATEEAAFDAQIETWRRVLSDRGLVDLDDGEDEVEAMVLAMHRYLVRTNARVLNAALTDAVGDRRTQNQPGTIDQYPNWRVPLSGPDGRPIALEELFVSARALRLASVMNGFSWPLAGRR